MSCCLDGMKPTDSMFRAGFREKYDLSDTTILVNQFGYRTSISSLRLNGRVDCTD